MAAAPRGSSRALSQGKDQDEKDGGMGEERSVKQTGTNTGQNQQENQSHIILNLEKEKYALGPAWLLQTINSKGRDVSHSSVQKGGWLKSSLSL